jgi:hypothetical protein
MSGSLYQPPMLGLAISDFAASAALAVVMLACILMLPQRPGRLSAKQANRI